jgi:hypothetical protein
MIALASSLILELRGGRLLDSLNKPSDKALNGRSSTVRKSLFAQVKASRVVSQHLAAPRKDLLTGALRHIVADAN